MRKLRVLSLALSVCFAVTIWSKPASAETIEITSGGVSELGLNFGEWDIFGLSGLNFSFTGHTCCGVNAAIPLLGGAASLSGGTGLVDDVPNFAPSTNVINGTAVIGFVRGGLTFTAPSVTLPPPTPGSMWQFSSPFTATGQISVSAIDGGPALFTFDLVGSGTATINGIATTTLQSVYLPISANYEFTSPSPTPEPAGVWLLLASGLVASLYGGVRRLVL